MTDIVVNEIFTRASDDTLEFIELYNTTNTAVNIGGWFLSDSSTNSLKYEISGRTILDPYFYVVTTDNIVSQSGVDLVVANMG